MSDNKLNVIDLHKRYGEHEVLKGVSLQAKAGDVISIIGSSGSGKSTFLRCINFLEKPSEGTIVVSGQNIGLVRDKDGQLKVADKNQLRLLRTRLTMVFQHFNLWSHMTVLENVMMGGQKDVSHNMLRFIVDLRGSHREERVLREKACEVLDSIGMYHLRNETVDNLAYGRQKVCELGRALMTTPQLILLDEPAAGLNPSERREFVDILRKVYDSGIDLFLIEHNMDVVMNLSHRITVLNFGCKIAEGTPEEIQHDPQVVKAYLGDRFRTEE